MWRSGRTRPGKVKMGCSLSVSGDELNLLGVGQLASPCGKCARLRLATMLLDFEESQNQIAQGGHHIRTGASADLGGVLPQTDVAAVMRSVLTGRPMAANEFEQPGSAVLLRRSAGAVKTVFFKFLADLALPQLLLLPPQGDKLPTTTQAGFFGAKTDALDAPPDQPAVLLAPACVVFRGKKNLGASGCVPAPEHRFGCL